MYFYGQGADGRAARQERGIGVDGAPFWGPSTARTREDDEGVTKCDTLGGACRPHARGR